MLIIIKRKQRRDDTTMKLPKELKEKQKMANIYLVENIKTKKLMFDY